MQTIPSNVFYANSLRGYTPPALRKEALDCRQLSNSKPLHFSTQREAFEAAQKLPLCHIFAEDLDSSGQRHYLVATLDDFWNFYKHRSVKNCYEVIRENVSCKLYFDLEYDRACNPTIDENVLVSNIIEMVQTAIQHIFKMTKDASFSLLDHVLLDSSTAQKYSKHLIFTRIAFPNNLTAGKFVNTCMQMNNNLSDLLVLKRKQENSFETVSTIDLSVYSRNRCFRLWQSSKFGESRPLKEDQSFSRFNSSREFFEETLVCCFKPRKVKLIDEAQIGYIRPIDMSNSSFQSLKKGSINAHSKEFANCSCKSSPFPEVDCFVLSIVCDRIGTIRSVSFFASSLKLVYSIDKYKFCENIQRHHKSNHILIVVDLKQMIYYQRCLDPECRAIDYRSPGRRLPEKLISSFVPSNKENSL